MKPRKGGKADDTSKSDAKKAGRKRPFDIGTVLQHIREAIRPYPKAALFELAEEGHTSAFEVLVGCLISIRTRDETTLPVARQLFAVARTPAEVDRLSLERVDELIGACTFHEGKARQIKAIAQEAVEEYGGAVPCDPEVLLGFHGVGPKCANLVLGIAGGLPLISVDIHVHRITNRWGYVQANTPEKTLAALQAVLPKEHWLELNALLVPFGKHVCTGAAPRCSTCPVLAMCRQVGVTSHR